MNGAAFGELAADTTGDVVLGVRGTESARRSDRDREELRELTAMFGERGVLGLLDPISLIDDISLGGVECALFCVVVVVGCVGGGGSPGGGDGAVRAAGSGGGCHDGGKATRSGRLEALFPGWTSRFGGGIPPTCGIRGSFWRMNLT